jgi:hypothetical protein
MADQADHSSQNLTRLTVAEVQQLADRLFSRGVSRLMNDQPSVQSDMRAASRVIRALLNRVDRAAAMCGDAQSLLCKLVLEIDG